MKVKCNFDCFNCIYDDCIEDSTASPYNYDTRKKEGSYYSRHREERKAQSLQYYYKNKEKILQKRKEKKNACKSI